MLRQPRLFSSQHSLLLSVQRVSGKSKRNVKQASNMHLFPRRSGKKRRPAIQMSIVSRFHSHAAPVPKLNQERVSLRRIFLNFGREVVEQKINLSVVTKTYPRILNGRLLVV
jgi:hypothetical protein